MPRGAGTARVLLAGVRLVNGTAALVAPAQMGLRLGVDPEANPAAVYVMRLFGARTVLIGTSLLSRNPAIRRHALKTAYLIHVSDTVAALLARSRAAACRRRRRRRRRSSPAGTWRSP